MLKKRTKDILRACRALFSDSQRSVEASPTLFVPNGHFYSPFPDQNDFHKDHYVFDRSLRSLAGIDLNESNQIQLLRELTTHWRDFETDLESNPTSRSSRFHLNQDFFREADALVLNGMLRRFAPNQIIEVGSGHSSAVMLDTANSNPKWLPKLTFIEPYPERLLSVLKDTDQKRISILETGVQNVPIETFLSLATNDLLFIDSSHVSKIGSDVNYLILDVLPRLSPGVIIHVHDIFWPFEYPHGWVQQGRVWNESYLLRAFLTCNRDFEILLWNSWIGIAEADWLQRNSPLFMKNTGGSIYLRKIA